VSEKMRIGHPKEPALTHGRRGFDSLTELALDMRWTWNHATDQVWRQLDTVLWELTDNPWVVLQTVSRRNCGMCWPTPLSARTWTTWCKPGERRRRRPGGFSKPTRNRGLALFAYFSMEFMLSEALPFIRAGWAMLPAIQLKLPSDLGVPSSALGCSNQQGYFAR